MNVAIERAGPQQRLFLKNLSRFYVYEFTAFIPDAPIEESGLYPCLDLDSYWSEPRRHPFIVRVDGEVAGFVFVRSTQEAEPNAIDEFFILRKFGRRGVGKTVAMRVFDMFPGRWQVTQVRRNYPAQAFWRSVIAEYTGDRFQERYDAQRRSIQEFESRRPQP